MVVSFRPFCKSVGSTVGVRKGFERSLKEWDAVQQYLEVKFQYVLDIPSPITWQDVMGFCLL